MRPEWENLAVRRIKRYERSRDMRPVGFIGVVTEVSRYPWRPESGDELRHHYISDKCYPIRVQPGHNYEVNWDSVEYGCACEWEPIDPPAEEIEKHRVKELENA